MRLPSNKYVQLTDAEIAECRRIADLREGWLGKNVYNYKRRDTSRSQVDTDFLGMRGELAVAKLFGLGFDACGLRLKGHGRPDDVSPSAPQIDGGNDMTLPNGWTVQVKAIEVHTNTCRPYQFLMDSSDHVNPHEFCADVGIMAYVLKDNVFKDGKSWVKIPGYITRQRFLDEWEPLSAGSGKRAGILTSRFDPIEQLLKLCGR